MTARRAFLHVGTPKSGTTYLQQVLWRERDALADRGLLLPGTPRAHVQAARQLRAGVGALPAPWQELVAEAEGWHGDVLISREALSSVPAARAAQGAQSLAAAGFEVHVVITARDLGRQWPASWQEQVKSGSTETFADYMERMRLSIGADGPVAWSHVDAAEVARLWSAGTTGAVGRVHVVTVPRSGGAPDLLWSRFASVIGVADAGVDSDAPPSNTSLRVEQIELMRRVNVALDGRIRRPLPFARVVKGRLAQQVLGGRPGTSLRLGGDDLRLARERSARMVDELQERAIEGELEVVGELDDLLVPEPAGDEPSASTARSPVSAATLLGEAVHGIVGQLVRERASLPPGRATAVEAASPAAGAASPAHRRLLAEVRSGILALAEGAAATPAHRERPDVELLCSQFEAEVLAPRRASGAASAAGSTSDDALTQEAVAALADLLVRLQDLRSRRTAR